MQQSQPTEDRARSPAANADLLVRRPWRSTASLQEAVALTPGEESPSEARATCAATGWEGWVGWGRQARRQAALPLPRTLPESSLAFLAPLPGTAKTDCRIQELPALRPWPSALRALFQQGAPSRAPWGWGAQGQREPAGAATEEDKAARRRKSVARALLALVASLAEGGPALRSAPGEQLALAKGVGALKESLPGRGEETKAGARGGREGAPR